MNCYAERWVGSIRREALNYFIILDQRQLFHIIERYVLYYNNQRPHQGIEQNTPKGHVSQKAGKIQSIPVLGGLHNVYYRAAA